MKNQVYWIGQQSADYSPHKDSTARPNGPHKDSYAVGLGRDVEITEIFPPEVIVEGTLLAHHDALYAGQDHARLDRVNSGLPGYSQAEEGEGGSQPKHTQ